jgi:hypothetical protein
MTPIAPHSARQGQRKTAAWALLAALTLTPLAARAQEPIGQVKTASGAAVIERAGQSIAATPGQHVYRSDVLVTRAHASIGVTFTDNSLLALGSFSRLSLDEYKFNTTTHEGAMDVSLRRGTLAVKSGQIVHQTPEAMRVRTPTALLGVRGTEFVVRAGGDAG